MWEIWASLGSLGGIIVLLIVLMIVFKVVRKILKYVTLFFVLLLIVLGVFGYFIYKDAMDLKDNFMKSDNLYVLYNGDRILTGFSTNIDKLTDVEDFDDFTFDYISGDKLASVNEFYSKGKYNQIMGDNYKVFFIEYDIFKEIGEVEFKGRNYSNDFVLMVLESDDPTEIYKDELLKRGFSIENEDYILPDDIKAKIFAGLIVEMMSKENGPLFFIKEIRAEGIRVYPETALFKLLNFISIDFVKDKVFELTSKFEDKANKLKTNQTAESGAYDGA